MPINTKKSDGTSCLVKLTDSNYYYTSHKYHEKEENIS
jgi:hypothetical protein